MAVTQHRPQREDAKGRETADLKRENNQLKRTIRRLEKELAKARTDTEPSSVVEESAETPQKPQKEHSCPTCGPEAEMRRVEVIGRVYFICPDCKAKERAE
jgi:predicted RNA-binding Zn-ribbon protein involved in translation (DUF1610 family)